MQKFTYFVGGRGYYKQGELSVTRVTLPTKNLQFVLSFGGGSQQFPGPPIAGIELIDVPSVRAFNLALRKKRESMKEDHEPIAIDLMRRVKASFDPQNL
jgi:hypothetical protein